jgi:hypothetical protein
MVMYIMCIGIITYPGSQVNREDQGDQEGLWDPVYFLTVDNSILRMIYAKP